jgi:hypothetical protein
MGRAGQPGHLPHQRAAQIGKPGPAAAELRTGFRVGNSDRSPPWRAGHPRIATVDVSPGPPQPRIATVDVGPGPPQQHRATINVSPAPPQQNRATINASRADASRAAPPGG